ncbi:alpha-1,2-fucosyltransferase [uncultured Winogradskyella sp.]|uniref:alpha-1,2-fucosyltransferase n=1 Tax=uncultured Winogradskyella sp. TaxID=395353 RepID=UPI00260AD67A|nr:alpha-1,2-fucosyltransferase [uncultured Winogradskyella sp.]
MILIRLKGGLGNQMFQYAYASILAKKCNLPLKIDTQFFSLSKDMVGVTQREFELTVFKNRYQIATLNEINSFTELSFFNKIKRKLGFNYPKKHNEGSRLYQDEDYKLKAPVYVNGYFQSYKYFLGYEEFVKKIFHFSTDDLDAKNISLLSRIEEANTISIHVRRGDYVTDLNINNTHGLCDIEYYMASIDVLTKDNANSTLVFFSDDSDWVKKTFSHLSNPKIFVNHNTGSHSWKDMLLMSKCSHNIIANSSFSWWAAWLNSNSEKKVVAPKQWFADQSRNTFDLIPKEWIQI